MAFREKTTPLVKLAPNGILTGVPGITQEWKSRRFKCRKLLGSGPKMPEFWVDKINCQIRPDLRLLSMMKVSSKNAWSLANIEFYSLF